MPTFEAEITPGMAPREVVELARLVEAAGFDRLGLSCVALWPDTYQLQALVATATTRLRIGSMVTNPYTRHPAVHAAALATLHEVSDGRAFAGFGIGAGLEPLGIHTPRPVRTLRETIEVVQRLLAGERVTYAGETCRLDGAALLRAPARRIPLAIGSRSPRVLRLAGELADIALVGARHLTPALAADYRKHLLDGAARTGRDPTTLEVLPRVTLCVSHDEQCALASVKRFAAHYLQILGPHGPPVAPARRAAIDAVLARARGWYFDLDRYDPPELFELVDDDLARAFAVAGTPAQCADQLRAVMALGFEGVSCNLAAVRRATNYLGLRETIEGAAEMLARLRGAGTPARFSGNAA